jgi:hypothetical protein
MVSFGFNVLTSTPDTITRHGDTFAGPAYTSVEMQRRLTGHAWLL